MKIKLERLQEVRSAKELLCEMEKMKSVKEMLNAFLEEKRDKYQVKP
jgi:hypothetical protein